MATGKLVRDIAHDLQQYALELATYDPKEITEYGCDEPGGDVRLQLCDKFFMLWFGSPDYDWDHRGFWGSAWVPADASYEDCIELARDLIGEVAEHRAECRV